MSFRNSDPKTRQTISLCASHLTENKLHPDRIDGVIVMKKPVTALVALAILSSPAVAQIRPGDCRPVLPVLDKAASVLPQDVTTEPAGPSIAAKRKFLGLPFLLPLLALGGGCVVLCGGGGGGATPDTPPPPPPVSPA
jgi:hypothetical protein